MFKVTNYLITPTDVRGDRYNYYTALCALVNQWEDERCCDGESVFDTDVEEDFIALVKMYGIDRACDAHNESRFCFGGYNFEEPKSIDDEYLEKFALDEMDLEYFDERLKACGTLRQFADTLRVDAITELIEGDDNQTRFYLETEVFYTYSHKFAVKVTDVETEWSETCVADTKDELAKKLMTAIEGYYEMLDDIAKNEEE